jgi:hypothetical protein
MFGLPGCERLGRADRVGPFGELAGVPVSEGPGSREVGDQVAAMVARGWASGSGVVSGGDPTGSGASHGRPSLWAM